MHQGLIRRLQVPYDDAWSCRGAGPKWDSAAVAGAAPAQQRLTHALVTLPAKCGTIMLQRPLGLARRCCATGSERRFLEGAGMGLVLNAAVAEGCLPTAQA